MGRTERRGVGRPARGPSSEVGRRILEASRRLLASGGLEALTISAIEREAGVYSSAIHYHFGSKAGLKAALVETLLDESALQAVGVMKALPEGADRLDEALRRFLMIGGPQLQLAFFETLGDQIRDDDLHRRLIELYDLGKELFVQVLGHEEQPAFAESMRPLAQVVFAFLDGMNVQMLVDPTADDVAALELMREMAAAKAEEIAERSLSRPTST
jgi:AcrR family transcriptional regulator